MTSIRLTLNGLSVLAFAVCLAACAGNVSAPASFSSAQNASGSVGTYDQVTCQNPPYDFDSSLPACPTDPSPTTTTDVPVTTTTAVPPTTTTHPPTTTTSAPTTTTAPAPTTTTTDPGNGAISRNGACPQDGTMLTPIATPVVSAGDISLIQKTGAKSFGNLHSLQAIQNNFQEGIEAINVGSLKGGFTQNQADAVCLGLNPGASSTTSLNMIQNTGHILTIANRSASTQNLVQLVQNSFDEVQIFGFNVGIVQGSIGTLTVYNGSVKLIQQSAPLSMVHILKGSGVGTYQSMHGTLDLEDGTVGIVQGGSGTIYVRTKQTVNLIQSFNGHVEMWGGTIELLQGGSGTIVLHDGATIAKKQSTSGWTITSEP